MEDGLERMSMLGSFFRKQEEELAEKKALEERKITEKKALEKPILTEKKELLGENKSFNN